jgi:hypothetical protein
MCTSSSSLSSGGFSGPALESNDRPAPIAFEQSINPTLIQVD